LEVWKKRDPLLLILKGGQLGDDDLKAIEREVSDLINQAVRQAEESADPEVSTVLEDVYA
jgi:TPP-dependent pyruvate/acetoin dehydrogenase alpha subunit